MSLLLDTPESGSCTRETAFDSRLVSMATDTYQPLPNVELVDMIEKVAQANDIKLVNEQLGMDLKGQRFFGVCDVEGKDGIILNHINPHSFELVKKGNGKEPKVNFVLQYEI